MTALATQHGDSATQAASIELHAVTPGDADGLHALLTSALPDILIDLPRWRARWEWECWGNPYRENRPAGWVFVEGDCLVGHMGAVYLPLRTGDQRRVGAIVSGYVASQEAKARTGFLFGLQLAQAFFDSANATGCLPLATTANEKTGAVFARFGCKPVAWTREFWRAPANLPQMVRSCHGGRSRLIRHLQTGRLAGLFNGLLVNAYKCAATRPGIPLPSGCSLEQTADVESRITELAGLDQRYAGPGPGVERSAAYLHWRYATHPEHERIRLLLLRAKAGSLLGAAIVFLDQRPDRNVAVVEDIFASADRADVVKALLCAALGVACDQGADYLITMSGRANHRSLYWELGFEAGVRSAPAVLLPRAVMGNPLTDPEPGLEFWHGAMF